MRVPRTPSARARSVCATALAAAALAWPAQVHANGRFPFAGQLATSPTNPDLLALRASFGLLVSKNRGADWRWVCEIAMGYSGEEDPAFAFLDGATIIAGTFEGLMVSDEAGCAWSRRRGAIDGAVIIDVAAERGRLRSAVALAARMQPAVGDAPRYDNHLFATADNGATWSRLGADLDPAVRVETVEVAPSDARRVYVSGVRGVGAAAVAVLLVSRDRGRTWTERAIPFDPARERAPYVAAVDVASADRVYVRTLGAPGGTSRLHVTSDAGATFKLAFTARGQLQAFALSPDGATVYVGGPNDGVHVARRDDLAFTKTSAIDARCLATTADAVYACSADASGFLLARSTDGAATFTPTLVLDAVRGPLECAAGTVQASTCVPAWPGQKAFLESRRPPALPVQDAAASAAPATAPETPAAPARDGDVASGRVAALAVAALGALAVIAGWLARTRRRS